MQKIGRLVCAALLAFSFCACQKEEGPAEKAGAQIDKAVKDTGQTMKKAADSIKDTVKRNPGKKAEFKRTRSNASAVRWSAAPGHF